MRQIISLRVCEPGGYSTTYLVGQDRGGHEPVLREITVVEDVGMVTFANGETDCIPIGPGVSWRLAPKETT